MEILFKNEYLLIGQKENDDILYTYWTTQAEMEDSEYRKVLSTYLEWVRKIKPSKVIIEAQKSSYTVPLETQEWLNLFIYLPAIEAGVKRLAYVVSEDFLTQLSLELIVEDSDMANFDDAFQQKFFSSEEEAYQWLASN